MNTKYIASLFLILSALSSFGGKKCKLCRVSVTPTPTVQTPIQKPHAPAVNYTQSHNPKLLSHLKQVKIDIQTELAEINKTEKEMKAKFGDDYNKIENVWHDFIALDHSSSQEAQVIDGWFNIICNEMKSLEQASEQIQAQIFEAELEQDLDIELEKKTDAILIKHLGEADKFFFLDADHLAIARIVKERQTLPKLLKKIEKKIQELKA